MPYNFYCPSHRSAQLRDWLDFAPPTHPKQPNRPLRKSCLYQQLPPSHTSTGLEFASALPLPQKKKVAFTHALDRRNQFKL
jgi:hypothetical protein